MKKYSFKKFIRKIHLWLGLTSGLIVFIISLTGSIYVFQQEISSLVYSDILYVTPPAIASSLPPEMLWLNAQDALGKEYPLIGATFYKDPEYAWSFLAYDYDTEALTYFGSFKHYKYVYVNPYTGSVTGIIDYKYDFFNIIKYIHWSFLLKTEIGQPIVGWSTIIFVLMTITGLILWWPRSSNIRQRFKIKWNARWRRVNFDIHSVLGFYIIIVVIIIALTGLVWAFTWFDDAVYYIATGKTKRPVPGAAVSLPGDKSAIESPFQRAFQTTKELFPDAESFYTTGIPADSAGAIYINANMVKGTYYKTNSLYFNRYTGELLKGDYYKNLSAGEKYVLMNYDIHIGAIGGLPTKILAFFASLVAASLPVTGFMIWTGRKKKRTLY